MATFLASVHFVYSSRHLKTLDGLLPAEFCVVLNDLKRWMQSQRFMQKKKIIKLVIKVLKAWIGFATLWKFCVYVFYIFLNVLNYAFII